LKKKIRFLLLFIPALFLLSVTEPVEFIQQEECLAFLPDETGLFNDAVECIKRFEGRHTEKHYPYVGYGHKLKTGETFNANIPEEVADSLLRKDLLKQCAAFRDFGQDSLLLGVLAYNIGIYRLLGNGKIPKSRLIQKLEAGNRNIYNEYISYRKYKGKILPSLERRRKEEFELLFDK
jgi:GH24 family phage-related lysozyme (muramidase)